MSSPAWYWHRLRAMSPDEMAGHARRKVHQFSDRLFASARFAACQAVPPGARFPELPAPEAAPERFLRAVRRDAEEILAGRWLAFGHLPLLVDDPPRWHKDYYAGIDLATRRPALQLNHRLEGKADIKLIWEPSRWFSLVRLAQAGWLLDHAPAASRCAQWLEHWAEENRPYFGWHWISGLESGLRLIQFAWIDALLSATAAKGIGPSPKRLAALRRAILPPHLWYTWRDRSFGSSANNHLIGELSGLIVALVRWPDLTRWAAPLDRLQPLWEKEVLTQFASDGGNREQALNYHLFSWEFCWQARLALRAAGRALAPPVEERLEAAARFFVAVQSETEPWDYGDSDNAYVTPFFIDWPRAVQEWHAWLRHEPEGAGLQFWIRSAPKPAPTASTGSGWQVCPESGFIVFRDRNWFLRWDLSPLGYLRPAGHGHCDALHLSIWFRGAALVIDPGTGAYHADRALRDYLASWEAHNGPHPPEPSQPKRMGTFLYASHHPRPRWTQLSSEAVRAELELPEGTMHRTLTRLEAADGWQVEDGFQAGDPHETLVHWQFAPGVALERRAALTYRLTVGAANLRLELGPGWSERGLGTASRQAAVAPGPGVCAPGFRRFSEAPFLSVQGRPDPPETLRTTFSLESSSS